MMNDQGDYTDWAFSIEKDTIQCRTYHAGPPAAVQPDVHCPHAAVYNKMHCGIDPNADPQPSDWACESYCNIVQKNCPGVYASPMECKTACATLPDVVASSNDPQIYPVSTKTCPTN